MLSGVHSVSKHFSATLRARFAFSTASRAMCKSRPLTATTKAPKCDVRSIDIGRGVGQESVRSAAELRAETNRGALLVAAHQLGAEGMQGRGTLAGNAGCPQRDLLGSPRVDFAQGSA